MGPLNKKERARMDRLREKKVAGKTLTASEEHALKQLHERWMKFGDVPPAVLKNLFRF